MNRARTFAPDRPSAVESRRLVGFVAGLGLLLAGCEPPPPVPPRPVLIAEPLPGMENDVLGQERTDLDRGLGLIQNERYADGIALVEKALLSIKNDADAVYHLAYAYERTGRRSEAEATYMRAIAVDPKHTSSRINLAAMYLDEPARPERAVAVLEPAVALDPKATDVRLNLAYAYRLMKDYAKAVGQYRAALATEDKVQTRQMLADVLFDAGSKDELVVELQKLVPSFSKNAKALGAIAGRFAKAGSYGDCLGAAAKAIALDGNDPSFWVTRGLCRHELGESEDAVVTDFERAIEIDSKHQAAHYYAAMSYLRSKKKTKGIEALDRTMRLGLETPFGQKAKERYYSILTNK